MSLHRVILSWPSVVNLTNAAGAVRSWIQLARIGSFVSKRYGKFAITRDDLAQMLHNFNEVTPKAPTELPIDYDHLSMDPKKPGDGMAAGWMKKLELRENGDELWAQAEWTPRAAEAIRNKEYRFISPSFIKDHVHKDGTKIGTTLLAAGLTSHPFLEQMAAVTLNTPAIAAMHLSAALRDLVAVEDGVISLSEVGQRVSIKQADELTPEERAMTFVIAEVRGDGDDGFVFLKTLDGSPFGWFRATQLAPARATTASPIPPDRRQQEDTTMHAKNADEELVQLATTIAQQEGISLRKATIEAGHRRKDLAEQRRIDIGAETIDDTDTPARPIINLHAGESFFALCQRTAEERQINLAAAISLVSRAHPDLAEAYGRGESL